jgi:uncharacterized protein YqjF (DUF2071 family)
MEDVKHLVQEVAHLRRALLTEKSLRVDVEEQNRRLRKSLFKQEQASRPTPFRRALGCVRAAFTAARERYMYWKGVMWDLINLEDIELEDPEIIERSKKSR